jgi:predicted ArsR family transcriptional regulator
MAIVPSTHPGGTERLTDPEPVARLGARRTQVLECLRKAAEPVTVATVAERTDLHVNTARFHLDGLVGHGLAERSALSSGSRGRPRIEYRARAPRSGPRSYQLLGRMLGGLVADLDPSGSAALRAGRSWGRQLVDSSPGDGHDRETALVRLDALMEGVGFAPVTDPGEGNDAEVRLHHCPFLEVAAERSEVVCAVHRGLMEGALDEIDAPLEVTDLRPFVRPGVCVARLRSR